MKHECYVFDFALDRALKQISDYSCRLNVNRLFRNQIPHPAAAREERRKTEGRHIERGGRRDRAAQYVWRGQGESIER